MNRITKRSDADDPLAQAKWYYASLARRLAADHPHAELSEIEAAARWAVETLAFVAVCQRRGLLPAEGLHRAAGDLHKALQTLARRFGRGLFDAAAEPAAGDGFDPPWPTCDLDAELLQSCAAGLSSLADADWPVEQLGRLHETLLGMRLTRDRQGRATVRRSAAVRKAAGIFYTPPAVTHYIVERTLGPPLLEQREAVSLGDLTLLDPACGAGAFLLAAARRLLPSQGPTDIARALHGVDLDREAVLLCRRALWLELLSGAEREPTADARALADQLAANIRCGDALTGPGLQVLDGRVDVVFGNPPYGRELDNKERMRRVAGTAFGRRWSMPRMDFWYYFIHRGLELLRPGGRLSFIVGAYWTAGRGAEKLIAALRDTAGVEEIFLLDDLPVFPNVSGRHMILRLCKAKPTCPTTVRRPATSPLSQAGERPWARAASTKDHSPTIDELLHKPAASHVYQKTHCQLFRGGRIDLEPPDEAWLARLDRFTPLGQLGKVRQGIAENPAAVTAKINARHANRWRVGQGVFALTPDELKQLDLSADERALIRAYHDLCDLGRYRLAERPSLALIYATADTCPHIERYPAIRKHLQQFRPLLEARRETRLGARRWWQLHWPRDASLWQSPKLIALQMARRPCFVPAPGPVCVPFSVNVFVPEVTVREHLNYFAAVLNSRLLWRWFDRHAKRRGVGLEINGGTLARAPIRRIDFADPADRRRHDRLVDLVGEMLLLLGESSAETCDRVAPLERQIGGLVCQLYDVEEIECV